MCRGDTACEGLPQSAQGAPRCTDWRAGATSDFCRVYFRTLSVSTCHYPSSPSWNDAYAGGKNSLAYSSSGSWLRALIPTRWLTFRVIGKYDATNLSSECDTLIFNLYFAAQKIVKIHP